ncbi:hypothetical protein AVEN_141654-1 [Araneus ventricosus]|uniref:RNase H type-1 domain-containing protein n=1 Tax=Araneus ventricosus TaxID=182803 RepID=A0A4Y2ITC5_ARAVE|nr:hypothetical protein AVEN_141654-1 [Araneus ventricosus]
MNIFKKGLHGILQAVHPVRRVLEKKNKINIITDSQSSIEALRSSRSRSEVVISAKENFNSVGGQIGPAWVKAHAGNPGNELADHHAKLATIQGGGNALAYSLFVFEIQNFQKPN